MAIIQRRRRGAPTYPDVDRCWVVPERSDRRTGIEGKEVVAGEALGGSGGEERVWDGVDGEAE